MMHLSQTRFDNTQRRHPLKSRSAQKTKGGLSPATPSAVRCALWCAGHVPRHPIPATPHLQEDI